MSSQNHEKKKITSCGACVYRFVKSGELEILLVKPFADKNVWGIPKGHINDQETREQCALREVFEETGLVIELEDPLPSVITRYRSEEKTVYSWLAQQVCDSLAHPNDSENADVRWFAINALPELHVYQKSLIEVAVKILRKKLDDLEHIKEMMKVVYSYAQNVDDWLTVKKELLKVMRSEPRELFSIRDEKTKKQRVNSAERYLAEEWSVMTGRPLLLTSNETSQQK